MLFLNNYLVNKKILSIRDTMPIAFITKAICNPSNLKVEGFYCIDFFTKETKVLLNQDIREVSKQGFVVNDQDSLTSFDELIRLKKVIELNYTLINKPVETISKKKIGKIDDFSFDSEIMYINKIYVYRSILKNFNGAVASVDRNQIIELTDNKVIIEDLEESIRITNPIIAT